MKLKITCKMESDFLTKIDWYVEIDSGNLQSKIVLWNKTIIMELLISMTDAFYDSNHASLSHVRMRSIYDMCASDLLLHHCRTLWSSKSKSSLLIAVMEAVLFKGENDLLYVVHGLPFEVFLCNIVHLNTYLQKCG